MSTQNFDIRDNKKSQNVMTVKEAKGIEDPEIVYVTAIMTVRLVHLRQTTMDRKPLISLNSPLL